MEFDRRSVRWYWATLYTIFCGLAIAQLLHNNPYLYSHKELKREIQTETLKKMEPVPPPEKQTRLEQALGAATYTSRFGFDRTAIVNPESSWPKNFKESFSKILEIPEGIKPTALAIDESGVFIGTNGAAYGFDLNGESTWEFKFLGNQTVPIKTLLADQLLIYLVLPTGEVVALNKKTGRLQWHIRLHEEIVGQSLILGDDVLIPTKTRPEPSKVPRPTFRWLRLKRATGEIGDPSRPIEAKPDFEITYGPDIDLWLIASENKLIALDAKTWEVQWSQLLTDPISGPVAVYTNFIYASTLGGKIVKLDGAKKGRLEWEVDVDRPLESSPTILPIMNKISVMDVLGQLQLIDSKAGKALWHFNIENKNTLKGTWSARLKGSLIQETSMVWAHRGWTIWAPCSKSRFCVYNPAKGQLISRVPLSGSILTYPMYKDGKIYFIVEKDSRLAISQVEGQKAP